MPVALSLAILLSLGFGADAFDKFIWTSHRQVSLNFEGDTRDYTLHILRPTEASKEQSFDSPLWLNEVAQQIEVDAIHNGYMTGVSARFYREELELFRQGRWSSVFITERDSWEVLLHLCYANRWYDRPLPWERRFLGDDGGYLPRAITSIPRVGHGGYYPSRFHYFTELNERDNRVALLGRWGTRPHIVGERTELKFLFGKEPNLLFLRELLRASRDYDLYRSSYRRPSKRDWREYEAVVAEIPTFGFRLRSRYGRKLEWAVYEQFYGREAEPYILNSQVDTQISGMPVGKRDSNVVLEFFIRKLGLEHPTYSFFESPSIGTAGIRTDISQNSFHWFDQIVVRSLDGLSRLPKAIYGSPLNLTLNHSRTESGLPCANLFSHFEKALKKSL